MTKPLEEIQDGILERLLVGEPPDREALLARHPEHAESLGAFLDLLAVIEGDGLPDGPEPTRLGEFRIVREIGRGGMGIVYEAEQPSLRRRVALKVLPASLRMDPRLVARFRREAEAAGRLRHPGIVPVYSVGEAAGAPFFAMELVEGETLAELIRRAKRGDDRPHRRRFAVEIAVKVADALAYAHRAGILHRDVKPGNVIVDGRGEPRLTDFGLALDRRAPGLTVPGEMFGSPQYMSPEQAVRRDSPVDERTDVYSLAVTLYEMLTLRLPYDGTTSAELLTALAAGRVVPPREVDPGISPELEGVLLRALRKDPRERYDSAEAFAGDLRACLEDRRPAAAAAPRVVARPASARRPPWLVALIAFGLIVGLSFLGFLIFIGVGILVPDPGTPWSPPALPPDSPPTAGPPPVAEPPMVVRPPKPENPLADRLRAGFAGRTVDFRLAFEELIAIEDEARRDRIRDAAFDDTGDFEIAGIERTRGRAAAEAFCRDWNEMYSVDDHETQRKYARLESDLEAAGTASAPYLLDVLARHPDLTFWNGDPAKGPTARMQVRALYAVARLKLRAAIPYVVLHCRGPSLTSTSTAATLLEKLTGEDFDAAWLSSPDLWKIDWWNLRAPADRECPAAFRKLVRSLLDELREVAAPGGPGWSDTGRRIVADLGMLLKTSFPFPAEDGAAARTDLVDRIEAWWRENG